MTAGPAAGDESVRAPRPPSTRRRPVSVIGPVNVLAPTGASRYWRLTWTDYDGRPCMTTAGRELVTAEAKAREIASDLGKRAASGSKAMATVKEMIDDYCSTGVGRGQRPQGSDWDDTYLGQNRSRLARASRGHDSGRCLDLDRALLDEMRAQGGTRRTRSENAKALRGLIRWGAQSQYLNPAQAELLPVNLIDIKGTVAGTELPSRRTRARAVGESEEYIRP